MDWLFQQQPERLNDPIVWIYKLSNLLALFILFLLPAILGYFWKMKRRGPSDFSLCICMLVCFMMGTKKFLVVFMVTWTPYPLICTMIDVLTAMLLVVQIVALPRFILSVLSLPPREDLLEELRQAKGEIFLLHKSNTDYVIVQSQLHEKVHALTREIETIDWVARKEETTNELRSVLDSIGGSSGDGDS